MRSKKYARWDALDKRITQLELKLGLRWPEAPAAIADAPDDEGYTALWTDGGCLYNGFPNAIGAWAWRSGNEVGCGIIKDVNGLPPTCNKAEACAAIHGLRSFPQGARVLLKTDSRILMAWIDRINRNRGWKGCAIDRNVAAELSREVECRCVRVRWVKAHNGAIGNEWCDQECQRLLAEAVR